MFFRNLYDRKIHATNISWLHILSDKILYYVSYWRWSKEHKKENYKEDIYA